MSRKDLVKNRFPTEYEEEVLTILETYGSIADPNALADLMGVNRRAMASFLQTTKAKEAMAKAHPDAKKLLRPHIQLPSTTQDQALPDEAILDDLPIYESEIPDGLASAYRLIKEK